MSTYSRKSSTPDSNMKAACSTETSIKKTPMLEISRATELPESTLCVACSADGRFLGLGHSRGFSVWCASSLLCAAEWLQDGLEMTYIQITRMAEKAYLLGTVDDMGVARVFAYHCESIHLLSVINTMENINKRSICLTFELSEGGHYGAASISCNSDVWLEVYHFPSDAWLKELEMEPSQNQDPDSSADVEVKWSPLAAVIKIQPPKTPAGTELDGPLQVLQKNDFLTHCLALDKDMGSSQWDEQPFDKEAGKINESLRLCTHHFLLPCGQLPGDSHAKDQPALPVSVCVWWSSSHNLFHYLLRKSPKNKTDVEPMLDVLWPNAKEILCSAVSRCTRFIALGLDDALVCVWDRQSGSPLSVVPVSAADSAFSRMQFVDVRPESADDSQTAATVCLSVLCKSGTVHAVTSGRGAPSCTAQLNERPKDSGDIPTVIAPVPFLQSMTFQISTPCSPVYALNTKLQTLVIQGEQESSCSAGRQSQLFSFTFGEHGIMEQYIISHPDSQRQNTLEEACNIYLLQRALSVDERSKAIAHTWKQLQDTAELEQQRHS
ncbi:WD repeat-containing protein 93 isoform X2 [Notothenia coriiceps]|uniref:WD repeat-containing protein 93 isoform X2 n=1 Tax=Notothenia coriiceps TaxID=8208 RepID=A0A6I9PXM6_9TELE|nr:PREDICTED: WD repeat-containing protein 93 isoform X2 [Notothenia coriiceps]